LHAAEDADDFFVEIVIDFDAAAGFAQQDAGGTSKGFYVDAVWWQVSDDPWGNGPFAAEVAQKRSGGVFGSARLGSLACMT